MELIIIILLIIVNGVFAMAEIAIISIKRSKLQRLSSEGDINAQALLELSKNPNRFLSTIQIGITLIGIFAGAFGGATIARGVSSALSTIPPLAQFSDALALFLVVLVITYLSLVVGELVPKRIALVNPDSIALVLARPMRFLSQLFAPVVDILSFSTDWMLKAFGVNTSDEVRVSEEEVKMLIKEGARVGVFEVAEKDIFERTLRLGDKKVSALMTPRTEVVWIDVSSSFASIRKKILTEIHSYFPVAKGSLEHVEGVVATRDIFAQYLKKGKVHVEELVRKPATVPENMPALNVLELFKKTGVHVAMVVDEYGNMEGLISLNDILEAIVGDIPSIDDMKEQEIMKRKDGSYLVDGIAPLDEVKDKLKIKRLPGEHGGGFNTIGGFMMHSLGRLPVSGDTYEHELWKFEVVDMDGNRVDKVLISKKKLLA